MSRHLIKAALSAIAVLSLAACATDTSTTPPPPAPAGPPVNLSNSVSDAAAVYVAYVNKASHMDGRFEDAEAIQSKLQEGAGFEPKQLARGIVAFGAIVAMQEPSFRSSLRGYASDPAGRADLINRLMANQRLAASLTGGDIAARRVILALSSDGEAVYRAGTKVKQAAYDIQKQGWSKEFVKARDQRLSLAKANSSAYQSVNQNESARLLNYAVEGKGLISEAMTGGLSENEAAAGEIPETGAAKKMSDTQVSMVADKSFDRETLFATPYTPTVYRALTIAALSILGEGTGQNEGLIASYLDDGAGSSCLGLSKLNLYQCLSVAKPNFEDVFCMGQHVLMDTGQCIGKMSSQALNAAPARLVQARMDDTGQKARPYITPAATKKTKVVKAKGKKKAHSSR
jgi:hypothetical protein